MGSTPMVIYNPTYQGGAVYNAPPTRVMPTPTIQGYSLATIQVEGEKTISFMVKASPALLAHTSKSMHETGWLYLFNDAESLAIRADRVVAITMVAVSKEDK
jgi:hypothetical protein